MLEKQQQKPEWFEETLIALYPVGEKGLFNLLELAAKDTQPAPLYRKSWRKFEQAEAFVTHNWSDFRLVSKAVLEQEAEDRRRYIASNIYPDNAKAAKPPLDVPAALVYGAYLLDLDLLEQERQGSQRHQELTSKTDIQRLFIELCQQWNGEGDGSAYMVTAIRALEPPVRGRMSAMLQDAGVISDK
jgi:hypothetical protein